LIPTWTAYAVRCLEVPRPLLQRGHALSVPLPRRFAKAAFLAEFEPNVEWLHGNPSRASYADSMAGHRYRSYSSLFSMRIFGWPVTVLLSSFTVLAFGVRWTQQYLFPLLR
jgi:hypothetical protein